MKKLFVAAIAIMGAIGASAQSGPGIGSQSAVSSATNTLAGPVTGDVPLALIIHNIIRISPDLSDAFIAHFDAASELDNGLPMTGLISGANGVTFAVSSNRPFHIDLSATPIVKTLDYLPPAYPAGQSAMPLSVIELTINELGPNPMDVTNNAYENGNYDPLAASLPNILQSNYGANQRFKLQFQADPGWDYEGGVYATLLTVTATQE
jgi:hypothetical protein